MRLKRTVKIYLCIVLVAVLFSCGKEKEQINYINADFKKYFDYQQGSYWVFFDSLNHHRDSLYVYGVSDKQETVNQGVVDEELAIGMMEQDLDSATNSIEWALDLGAPYSSDLTIDLGFNEILYVFLYNMPFQLETVLGDNSVFKSWTSTILPTFSIGNTTYNNVYEIFYLFNSNSYSDTFYLNADKGFIAIMLNDQNFHKRLFLTRGVLVH